MFRTTFSILLIALYVPYSFAEITTSEEEIFAIFFNYSANNDLSYCSRTGLGRCTLGTMKQGQSVQLLSSENSSTCLAHALKSFPSNWDTGSFPLTQIDLSSCPDFNFNLAVLTNKPIVYERLENLPRPSAPLSKKIDIQIRQNANELEPSSDEHQFALASAKPELFQLPNMEDNNYIAIYQNTVTPGDQVHFLYTKGKVKLIHSAATIESIFGLDEKYFIHYSFTCRIGCGYGGDIIFKFSNDDFERVMFDDSTSS